MSLLSDSHYWFVERDQIGIGYYSAGAWTSPASAVTLRIYGDGFPDALSAESDEFNFAEEFHHAPLYFAVYQYAMLKGDTAKYQMFKQEFLEQVLKGKKRMSENRTDGAARGLALGVNGVGY